MTRVQQARVSDSLSTFKEAYMARFHLRSVIESTLPVVLFGMYSFKDYLYYGHHSGPIIIVWCGRDVQLIDASRARTLKSKVATHFVKSSAQSALLNKWGIPHTILPISWQTPEARPVPKGTHIYHYGNGKDTFYGDHYIPEIERRTGYSVIKATYTTYTKEELQRVYESCFIGLRLTPMDGLPNTVLELGLMGRRCVYNGSIPNAIPWKDEEDIYKAILNEYCRANEDIYTVAEDVKNFIDIGEEWLYV